MTLTWRWVVKPNMWRYVAFASAVVGLVFYALTSSFNHLFGNWNLLKIVLYSVFSFIISLMVFCAELLQHPKILRFKADTAFLVLAVTSAYSFFIGEVKPDLYSLISTAAFAVMSLSLSRQTHFGFEMDVLYFFLGSLIGQLVKIKLLLFFVGAAFSHFLIIIRAAFPPIVYGENNQNTHLQDGSSVFISVASLIQRVTNFGISSKIEQLRKLVTVLQHENSDFVQVLMKHVENYVKEYPQLVVVSPTYMMDALKPETIKALEETSKVMVSAGFQKDFSDAYINCRRECLNECLMHTFFGVYNLSIEDVQNMSWENLEAETGNWIKTFNVTLKILLPGERQLCNHIFFGSSTAADLTFVKISREPTTRLLNFANSLANGNPSTGSLFKMFEVFETLRDIIPDFNSLFCQEYSLSLRNNVITTWERLGKAIREMPKEYPVGDLSSHRRDVRRIMDTLESNLNEKFKSK